jgi:hypothetical protein
LSRCSPGDVEEVAHLFGFPVGEVLGVDLGELEVSGGGVVDDLVAYGRRRRALHHGDDPADSYGPAVVPAEVVDEGLDVATAGVAQFQCAES